jgi:hypothetical protein
MWTGLCLLGFGLLLVNLPTLFTASQVLLQKAGSVNAIEVEGVKIGFDQGSVFSRLDAFSYLNAGDKAKILETVRGLEPDEFERLMQVGELADLCDYQHPTVEMRRMMTLDYQLNDKGLTVITDSPDLKARIKGKIIAGEETSHTLSDIGHPRSCYVMDLTDAGLNAKTVLVKILSAAFDPRVAAK